jgi:hypothetical protein
LLLFYSLLAALKMANRVNTGPGKENVTPDSVSLDVKALASAPKKATWLMADDAEMIRVLTEQQAAGNQSDNGWKSLVWTLIAKALEGSEERSGGAAKTAASCSGHWGKVCHPFLGRMEWIFRILTRIYDCSSRVTFSSSRPSVICLDGVGMMRDRW